MFNVKVFKIKDLIKYFIELLITIGIVFFITKLLSGHKQEDKIQEDKKLGLLNYDLTECIADTSRIIKQTNKPIDTENKDYKSVFFEDILRNQIGSIDDYSEETASRYDFDENIAKIDNTESNESVEKTSDGQEQINVTAAEAQDTSNVELAKTGLKTEVVTNNPLALSYNVQYGNVKIKNETSHDLTDEMLNPNINIDNKNILLFHTHTCESYTTSEQYSYTPTGNFRTTDLNFSVVRVGAELTNHLKKYGYNVIHDTTYHDYPTYNGSYTRSLETVQNILEENPTDIIFDVHRDAIGSRSDYAPCVKIGDDVAAQIMFVVGSDEGGLWHPNWEQNLKFAVKVQAKAEEMYPRFI